jgi:hypothetical protein
MLAELVSDLKHAEEMAATLAEVTWPVRPARVADARSTLRYVRESTTGVEQLGWPVTLR